MASRAYLSRTKMWRFCGPVLRANRICRGQQRCSGGWHRAGFRPQRTRLEIAADIIPRLAWRSAGQPGSAPLYKSGAGSYGRLTGPCPLAFPRTGKSARSRREALRALLAAAIIVALQKDGGSTAAARDRVRKRRASACCLTSWRDGRDSRAAVLDSRGRFLFGTGSGFWPGVVLGRDCPVYLGPDGARILVWSGWIWPVPGFWPWG